MATTTSSTIDPTVQPFLSYGLSEAQRLYQANQPQYVTPSAATQTALTAMQNRAIQGNPLLAASQQQTLGAIQGDYLGGNPFFQGAFAPAAQAAQTSFQDALSQIGGQASSAGRYGSNAANTLQNRAAGQFAQALTNTAGNLAYQNYAAERGLQQQAAAAAPALAQQDYADIQQLMKAGQTGEAYTQQAQQQAQQNLANFLNAVYGNPMAQKGSVQYSQNTGLLGDLATAAAAYNMAGGASGISQGWNSLTNWLSGL